MIYDTWYTYDKIIPAYEIVRPIFWHHREEAACAIQKWWKRASFQKKRRDAAKTIQKYWRRAISNPNYVVCRNRLMHEYSVYTSASAGMM